MKYIFFRVCQQHSIKVMMLMVFSASFDELFTLRKVVCVPLPTKIHTHKAPFTTVKTMQAKLSIKQTSKRHLMLLIVTVTRWHFRNRHFTNESIKVWFFYVALIFWSENKTFLLNIFKGESIWNLYWIQNLKKKFQP